MESTTNKFKRSRRKKQVRNKDLNKNRKRNSRTKTNNRSSNSSNKILMIRNPVKLRKYGSLDHFHIYLT